MKKIIIAQDTGMSDEQIQRLKKSGDVKVYKDLAKTYDEWLERVKDADIIVGGKFGMKEKMYELKDVFISLPFVGVGWIDKEKIKERNITVANSPGCNKDAVSEWIIGMMINLLRDIPPDINSDLPREPRRTIGLTGKKVCVLGKGNIGKRVGKICKALDMEVSYFLRGDNLTEKTKNSDVIINCLSSNPTTEGILDKKFFSLLKKGSYFVTVTSRTLFDPDAMINALDEDILSGVGIDAGSVQAGNVDDPFYVRLKKHPKIMATAHIASRTDVTAKVANDLATDNIEAWLKGKPINLI